jgi:hypothetical protein
VEVNWKKDGSPTGNQRISVANSGESFGKDGIENRKVAYAGQKQTEAKGATEGS